MVIERARERGGVVEPGHLGVFIADDEDSQPFKIETLSGDDSSYYYEGDIRKATPDEIRTKGAVIGDLVVIVRDAEKCDGCVAPGEVGKFIGDDHDSQPFKVLSLDKEDYDFYYPGDIAKATSSEIASTRTGGAMKGDFVMVLPTARVTNGRVKPGEIGKLVEDAHDHQPFNVADLTSGDTTWYYEGDIRKATDTEIANGSTLPTVGAQVKLTDDYQDHSDAADGPLEPDDVGVVGKVTEGSANVDFDGHTWWYDFEALETVGLKMGTRVRRGPDWKWEDQDGQAGNLGTVSPGSSDIGWFVVHWDDDYGENHYRWGADGKYDLEIVGME